MATVTHILLPDFMTISEFIPDPAKNNEQSFGDCMWDALMMAAHVYDRTKYPLNGVTLGSIRDDAIAQGMAAANGAVNIPNAVKYLRLRGYSFRCYGYDNVANNYNPFTTDVLHSTLKAFFDGTLTSPVIIETSTDGLGLPEDEPTVQFHYFTIGGADVAIHCPDGTTGGYYRGDGDAVKYNAWPGPKAPIPTSWEEIFKTTPVGFMIIDGIPGDTTIATPAQFKAAGWTDTGNFDPNNFNAILTAPNKNVLVHGFRVSALTDPKFEVDDQPAEAGEHYVSQLLLQDGRWKDGSRVVLLDDILVYAPNADPAVAKPGSIHRVPAGPELLAAYKIIDGLTQQVHQLGSTIAALQAAGASVNIAAVKSDVDAAEAELAKVDTLLATVSATPTA
jgi:hypothetical protein